LKNLTITEVVRNHYIFLHCEVENNYQRQNLHWKLPDNKIIAAGEADPNGRFISYNDGSLIINVKGSK
jgi:hypothetical protein